MYFRSKFENPKQAKIFSHKKDIIKSATLRQPEYLSHRSLDADVDPALLPISITIASSSFTNNQGYVVVTDSYSCASTSTYYNPANRGTYFPSVIWYDNVGAEIHRIQCLQGKSDTASVFPITPTVTARDDGGVTIAWIEWQYYSYNPNTSTRCSSTIPIVHCPPIPGPVSGEIRTVSITNSDSGYTPNFIVNLDQIIPKAAYVNVLPNSLSSSRLPNGKSITSSTQVEKYDSSNTNSLNYSVVFYAFNADLSDAGLDNTGGGLHVTTEPAETPYLTQGMASSRIMSGTLVNLDTDHFVEVYYSIQSMAIIMKLYDSNINSSTNFFPTTKINGNQTIIKLAVYDQLKPCKILAAVWQSQDAHNNYQIMLSILEISISPFTVKQIVKPIAISNMAENIGYNNMYPALTFLETGKLEIMWSRCLANNITEMLWQCDLINDPQCQFPSHVTLSNLFRVSGNSFSLIPFKGDTFSAVGLNNIGQLFSLNFSALNPLVRVTPSSARIGYHGFNTPLLLGTLVAFCMFAIFIKASINYFKDLNKEYTVIPSDEKKKILDVNATEIELGNRLKVGLQTSSSYFQQQLPPESSETQRASILYEKL